MALFKFAKATLVKPGITPNAWDGVRTASSSPSNLNGNLIHRAEDIFQKTFDPAQYLLSHATIVASVDVEEPPHVKLGSIHENGFKINRKYPDFRVKTSCEKWLNNNDDGWERKTLLKSYPTFVGGQNFVEHVQVDELSKGRIIDAVARDIGDSVYIDILIATDKQHRDLIASILDNRMSTLSMGCTIDFSVCTKCGHVAADETEMCRHVRYEKGNSFFDDQGVQRRVAELCGHHSVDPTGGVQFIEASWVATPAFTGAVLRNILEQETVPAEIHRKAQEVLSKPPPEWTTGVMQKAAQFDMGDEDEGEEKEKAPEKPPLELIQDELEQYVLEQVKKRIKDKIREKDVAESLKPEESTAAPNNNIIKQALSNEGRRKKSAAYRAGIFTLVKTAGSDVELIDKIATLNRGLGIDIPVEVYRTIVRVGSADRYRSLPAFYKQCRDVMERVPTLPELKTLIRLGQLLNMRHQINTRGEA